MIAARRHGHGCPGRNDGRIGAYSAARSTSVVIAPAVAPRTMSLLLGSTIFKYLRYKKSSKVAPGMRQETTSRSSEGRGTLMDLKRDAGHRGEG